MSFQYLFLAALLFVTACPTPVEVEDESAPLPTPADYDPAPESPTILRDVALIDDDVNFTQPFVPGHRTTMDGRVAIRVQGGPPGTQDLAENFSFWLFVPERLDEPILPGPPGAEIMAETQPFDVVFPRALDPEVTRLGHHALCDATEEFAVEGERPNPYVCGPDDADDCYDITILSSTSDGLITQLWGTPVTVQVRDPKTAIAAIVDVVVGEPVEGGQIRATAEFTEPAITMDGRLLTGRLGRFPRAWTNPETGETLTRSYDLAYSQLPDELEPCDVTGWTDFHPMSHAPYDPRMIENYGLAAWPFRDTEGNPIPDGEDMGGTYPWVDREGANVFMTAIHGTIAEQSEIAFPRTCVHEGCEDYSENVDWDRGFLVAGLWTHGKLVHLDGMINNVDWAVGVTPDAHWLVDMYKDDGEDVAVRFGSGRFVDAARDVGGPYPAGYTHNANILDSLQNLPNAFANAQPVTPRDVVWVMSTGVATDEIVFDDFLDPNAFIVSSMTASVTQLYDGEQSLSIPRHHNGQVRELNGVLIIAAAYDLVPDTYEEIHLQNAATSVRWNVPAYGSVAAGTGRVEPVALGGVHGRGFWLSGTNEIRYTVPEQPRDLGEADWYVGVHLDPRYLEGEAHTLFTFPDGSEVRLWGRNSVEYLANGAVVHAVDLPETHGWMHLGWQLKTGLKEATLFVDGFAFDQFEHTGPLFAMSEGDFVVGRQGEVAWGFRGWIDDLVVLAHAPTLEVTCNHAGGTLVRIDDNADWLAVADRYPDWAHEAVNAKVGDDGEKYACFADKSDDYAAHLANLPIGTISVRGAILFPEGPLTAGQPRPDSTHNHFCISCHTGDERAGLSLQALLLNTEVNTEHDRRRQPTQPPRRVFGNIPAGWIAPGAGPGSPSEATVAPIEGALIDEWLMPNAQ